ncbi:DNA polymerase III subunit beta [Kutzneria viridogrisea]|uniref:DNA polymerase III subunit beta n=2 Tax=Kutzneria TaxID=43356 RepID=W5VXU3_9PSEU|nr:DNA polymerase III subunit beta [Kutzneria albida]AHH93678.1 DNA polymerase III subunit beta [Kutzneria albida DSM 43870]MBA8931318.1 DNA polymerase-3 subunit beta [Kutzneria viridogrisea]
MDLTATTAQLAGTASDLVRLLPAKVYDPVLAGVLITADRGGLLLTGTDRERGVRLRCPAVTHTDGQVLVPAKPLAETLRALDSEQVRLVVEGSRLAIRVPGARFALPLLEVDLHPGVAEPPARVGEVPGREFARLLATVASVASRDDALPMLTGVRLRNLPGGVLGMVATDRYRMAVAELPWAAEAEVDAMVPAAVLVEAAKQAAGADRVSLHVDSDRAGLVWQDSAITTSLLASTLPDEAKVIPSAVETTVELEADALAGAVRRVGLYTEGRQVVQLDIGEGEIRVHGADPQAGEAEERVKAEVTGGRMTPAYQVRYLSDALKAFAGDRVRIGVPSGLRGTLFSSLDDRLRYLVVPIRPQAR